MVDLATGIYLSTVSSLAMVWLPIKDHKGLIKYINGLSKLMGGVPKFVNGRLFKSGIIVLSQ